MQNQLESLEKINVSNSQIDDLENNLGFSLPEFFKEILKKYNVCKPKYSYYKEEKIEFNLNFLFGFSDSDYRDLLYEFNIYEGRMPNELFPIGSIDGGDLLCMNKNTNEIYYWFHEEDDWGIEGVSKWPTKVGNNINLFLDSLTASAEPTEAEIERVKKEGKIKKITPFALKLMNDSREKKGLPPLTMEEALKL